VDGAAADAVDQAHGVEHAGAALGVAWGASPGDAALDTSLRPARRPLCGAGEPKPGLERLARWRLRAGADRIEGVAAVERHEDVEPSEQLALYHLDNPWVSQEERFGRAWTAGWERRRDGLASWKRTLYVRIL